MGGYSGSCGETRVEQMTEPKPEQPIEDQWKDAIRQLDKCFSDMPPIYDPNVARHNEAINVLYFFMRKMMERIKELEARLDGEKEL